MVRCYSQSALNSTSTSVGVDARLNTASPSNTGKRSRTAPMEVSTSSPSLLGGGNQARRPGSGIKRPGTSGQLPEVDAPGSPANRSKLVASRSQQQSVSTDQFKRSFMSASLPQLPSNSTSMISKNGSTVSRPSGSTAAPQPAWSQDSNKQQQQPSSAQPIELPAETTMTVGLMRIADKLARLVLPWQAVLCPRAVETLFDLRHSMIQSKHEAFINQMKQKLEEKVQSFVKKKEEEVELWLETELRAWRMYMEQDEADLLDYIRVDLKRISDRTILQNQAYRIRELVMTSQMDDHERDSTRQLLLDFRRVCKAQAPSVVTNAGGAGETAEKAIELKLLQDSIAKAQSMANHKMLASNRTIIRYGMSAHSLQILDDRLLTNIIQHQTSHHGWKEKWRRVMTGCAAWPTMRSQPVRANTC